MMTKWSIFLLTIGALACGSGPKDAEEALKDKGALDVLKDAGDDEYTPPADEKLTEKQVEMYLDVKKREKELVKVAGEELRTQAEKANSADKQGKSLRAGLEGLKALGKFGNFLTADIRAAQELDYNTAEYLWVKGKILEAGISTWSDSIQDSSSKYVQEAMDRYKEARKQATDDQTRNFYDEQIKNLEQQQKESQAEAVKKENDHEAQARRYNQQLISKHADQLKVLEDEIQKWKSIESKPQ